MKKSILLKISGSLATLALISTLLVVTGLVELPKPRRGPQQNDMVIDQAIRTEVVHRLIADLNGYYVFPDKAKAMESVLRAKLDGGAYNTITSAEKFTAALTADIQQVAQDRHLDVAYSEAVIRSQAEQDSDIPTPARLERMRSHNYGVEKVERLPFNIGYLDLRSFSPPDLAGPKLAAAMTLVADTEALIIDLRFNNGGEPKTVALLASYLFDERTRLNDIYDRGTDHTEEYWTSEQVAGPRFGGKKKVYLLVSHDTFSAGEDFSYAMKNLRRATLIGAATGGGAHPGTERRLNDHFGAIVPTSRSISPVTQTDWEGLGVLPDIAMRPAKALDHAQELILKDMLASSTDPFQRARIQDRLGSRFAFWK